jgi:hypothetical protein
MSTFTKTAIQAGIVAIIATSVSFAETGNWQAGVTYQHYKNTFNTNANDLVGVTLTTQTSATRTSGANFQVTVQRDSKLERYYTDAKYTISQNTTTQNGNFTPYIGFGFRSFDTDTWYAPVGVTAQLSNHRNTPGKISVSAEYDWFMASHNQALFNEAGFSTNEIKGYGYRISATYTAPMGRTTYNARTATHAGSSISTTPFWARWHSNQGTATNNQDQYGIQVSYIT